MNSILKLIFLLFISVSIYANTSQKNVLLLNSYHENLLWTNNITKAVKDVLKPDDNNIVLYIENMDTKRFYKKKHYGKLYQLYAKKYHNIKFDLILVSDNNAFDFTKEHRSELFGKVPTIFCGVNNFTKNMIENKNITTGVAEVLSVKETMELILKLTPDIKKLYVVNDYLTSGIAWKKDIQHELKQYNKDIEISYNDNLTYDELNQKIKSYKSDTAVLMGVYFSDKNDTYINTNMRTNLVTKKVAPVYALLNFDMISGAIGGKLTGGYYQGYPMGQIAKRVLSGTTVKDIDVKQDGSNKYVFNHNALKYYNINRSLIPENSEVINQPTTLYGQYKITFILVLSFIFFLIIVVFVLIVNIKKRKIAELNLENLNINLEERIEEKTKEQNVLLSLFDKGDSVLFKWNNDEHWSVEYVSESVIKLLEYDINDFSENKITYASCIYPDDLKIVIEEVTLSSQEGLSYFKHEPYRVITKNGNTKWVLDYTVIQRDENNNITHYVGYINDITKEKAKERLLAEQSKMVSMGEMIGNIAHQWRQPLSIISTGATGLKFQKTFGTLTDELFIETCDMIADNAQYLSKTIDDFRDYIKGDRKKILFNIKDTIESFLNIVGPSIKNHNINFIYNVENDIKVEGYPNELIQCLINIYNNSKDVLCQTKGINEDHKFVFLDVYVQNNHVIINIKDSGGGIPTDILSQIFEPYFTTKHKSRGTGLGLHMTYNLIVDGMHGTIKAYNTTYEYESTNYTGAQFVISLPI